MDGHNIWDTVIRWLTARAVDVDCVQRMEGPGKPGQLKKPPERSGRMVALKVGTDKSSGSRTVGENTPTYGTGQRGTTEEAEVWWSER